MIKVGIIREGKNPPDSRVPLTPVQLKNLKANSGVEWKVQPSPGRCYKDNEYESSGITLSEDVSDCQVLMGVKEVPINQLVANKTYFFFSHTIKEQAYNRSLLRACVEKNIRLIDYEVLVNEHGQRVIAFGKFAGMVGAHNALWTWAKRTASFDLPRMKDFSEYKDAKAFYRDMNIPPLKIVLTGTGRVAQGAAMVLEDMGIEKVSPLNYVSNEFEHPVFTQVNSFYYAKRKDGKVFDSVQDFYDNPADYNSDFGHFLPKSDIMINGIYWDNDAPAFFTKEQMRSEKFRIRVISDVTCDIAPVSSIPSTLKASTIADPIFGYDVLNEDIVAPHGEGVVDMMTIDNLPNELPRDASEAFGAMFIDHVLPELLKEKSDMLDKATICQNGDLGKHFEYLRGYLEGK